MKSNHWLIALLGFFLATTATAHEEKSDGFVVLHPWTAATSGSATDGAVYMTIRNRSGRADRLVGVMSPDAGSAQLHEFTGTNPHDRMTAIEEISIPDGGEVRLEPGGRHLMLVDLKVPLFEETLTPLTLVFEKTGPLQINVVVEEPRAEGKDDGSMHHRMKN